METLEKNLGYTFTDRDILEKALTHSSWANENNKETEHNERLEFLGDAVLELSISDLLYREMPQVREGELTRIRSHLVSEASLAGLARRVHLDQFLLLGKGEENQGGRGRDTLLGDALEAVFGAVFLDGGFLQAKTVIGRLFQDRWQNMPPAEKKKDYKTLLQEYTQQHFRERPVYTLLGSEGPEHAKVFEVSLRLPDGNCIRAQGGSLKRAEQETARVALAMLELRQK